MKNNNTPDFSKLYNQSQQLLKDFEKYLTFEFDKTYGYINSEIDNLGAGMEISSLITLKKIIDSENFINKISNFEFDYHNLDKINCQFFSKKKFKLSGYTQIDFIQNYYNFISGIINIDRSIENRNNNNNSQADERNLLQLRKAEKISGLENSSDELKIFSNGKNANEEKKNFLDRELLKKSLADSYFKNFEKYEDVISPLGTNINNFIEFFQLEDQNNQNDLNDLNNNLSFLKDNIFFSDLSEYNQFRFFVSDLIMNYQDFNVEELDHIYKADDFKSLPSIVDSEKKLKSFRISCIRNLPDFIFGVNNNLFSSAQKVKEIIKENFEKEKLFDFKVFDFNSEEFNEIEQLNKINFNVPKDFKNENNLKSFNFNEEERCLIKPEKEGNFYFIVNDLEHLRFECYENNTPEINKSFIELMNIITKLEKNLKFSYSKKLGYITSNPKYLGTGLIFEIYLTVKNLLSNKEKLNTFFKDNTFIYDIINEEEGVIRINNHATIGYSENDLLRNLIILINELIENDNDN